jgi:putative transposase
MRNEVWDMHFVSDQLFDRRSIRLLAVLDAHTQEALSIVPRVSFRAFDVVQKLDRPAREGGRPTRLKVDNYGPEFDGGWNAVAAG